MSDIWDRISMKDVVCAVDRNPLPECNRGSWFNQVATKEDAVELDYRCRKRGIDRIYDLGAGTLELSIEMDKRGYDVVAYESLASIVCYALDRHVNNTVDVRVRDYYSDWDVISQREAAFVAIGKRNHVPGTVEDGFVVDRGPN